MKQKNRNPIGERGQAPNGQGAPIRKDSGRSGGEGCQKPMGQGVPTKEKGSRNPGGEGYQVPGNAKVRKSSTQTSVACSGASLRGCGIYTHPY